jgi:DNA-binding response OmpR family regulator
MKRVDACQSSCARADPVHHGHGGIQDRERDRGEEAGVNNYIVKPFNAQTLQNKVQSVFPDDAPPPRAA